MTRRQYDAADLLDGNIHTIVETRIAYDRAISCLARQLYIGLCGEGAWARSISVSTREWALRLRVSAESIRKALRQLTDHHYVRRIVRPGARMQQVQAVGSEVGETTT